MHQPRQWLRCVILQNGTSMLHIQEEEGEEVLASYDSGGSKKVHGSGKYSQVSRM